jgi:hypothetical protein
LDVPRTAIHQLLKEYQDSGKFKSFFDMSLRNETGAAATTTTTQHAEGVYYTSPEFIENTHVTMAFAGRKLSAKSLASKFGKLQGCHILLKVQALLWSDTHAALDVSVSSMTTQSSDDSPALDVPRSENPFCHITVWCSRDSQAYHSNRLPALVEEGKAQRVPIDPEVSMMGTLSFWDDTNEPFHLDEF